MLLYIISRIPKLFNVTYYLLYLAQILCFVSLIKIFEWKHIAHLKGCLNPTMNKQSLLLFPKQMAIFSLFYSSFLLDIPLVLIFMSLTVDRKVLKPTSGGGTFSNYAWSQLWKMRADTINHLPWHQSLISSDSLNFQMKLGKNKQYFCLACMCDIN